MGRRATIDRLTPGVRQMLLDRLYARGFSDYQGLVDELRTEGIEVSKSSLHRFGKKLERALKERETEEMLQRSRSAAEGAEQ